MVDYREILRLDHEGQYQRQIAASVSSSRYDAKSPCLHRFAFGCSFPYPAAGFPCSLPSGKPPICVVTLSCAPTVYQRFSVIYEVVQSSGRVAQFRRAHGANGAIFARETKRSPTGGVRSPSATISSSSRAACILGIRSSPRSLTAWKRGRG